MSTETNKTSSGISRTGTFGMHEEWLQEYLADPLHFWNPKRSKKKKILDASNASAEKQEPIIKNNSLGNKQEESFRWWLDYAGIINKKQEITEFGQFCKEHYEDEHDLIWELIWINFAHNSALCGLFMNKIQPNQSFNKELLVELALSDFPGIEETAMGYYMGGFMQLFNYSPIGYILQQGCSDEDKTYIRMPHDGLSEVALAYSLYKYSNLKNVRSLRVSDFYKEEYRHGPFREFGISKSIFDKLLRQLNSANNRVLIAELNMGLDSITLRDDLTPMDVLKQLVI